MLLALLLSLLVPQESPKGEELAVRHELIRNGVGGENRFRAVFTLTNKSPHVLDNHGWAIYFSFARHIFGDSVTSGAQLEKISGDFWRLTATEDFPALAAGESVTIHYEGAPCVIKVSDAPGGFYIVFSDAEGNEKAPEVLADVKIQPLSRPEQIHRNSEDKVPIPSPEWRYRQNERLTLLPLGDLPRVVPTPRKVENGSGRLTLDSRFTIHYENGLASEAEFLAEALETLLGTRLETVESASKGPNVIALSEGLEGEAEGYELTVRIDEGVHIQGADRAGVFYAIQSLRALIPVDAYRNPGKALSLEEVHIIDAPRFAYRGLHLDVARNFQSKQAVLKLLELMAFYKLNKLHFHLTDDEGWRLEIEGLPELTEVGGFRGHTLNDEEHLHPSYGSGPFPDPERSFGSGYYSIADFKEILEQAQKLHIEVIPEIDLPGHARAAIKSMETRYRRSTDRQYLLSDMEDESQYESVQGYKDNVICVCQESTYRFVEKVFDGIVSIYRAAGAPLRTIHIGGDEVPAGVWERSPACRSYLAEHPDVNDLFAYFVERLRTMLDSKGLATAGWEEIGMKGDAPNPELAGRVVPYIWNNLGGNQDLAYRLANAGYEVVLCNVTNLYFDLAYDKDPEEPGLYWGGFVDTLRAFEIVPLDVFKSNRQDALGNRYDFVTLRMVMEQLKPESRENILGIQGQLWSETLKGEEMMEYYLFPKLLGLAERAWAPAQQWAEIEDTREREAALSTAWNTMANVIGRRELPRLDYLNGGVGYRIPPPGAVIDNGRLEVNVAYPGLTLRYTTDGSEPSATSTLYTEPVAVSGNVKIRAFDSRGRGSRTVDVSSN